MFATAINDLDGFGKIPCKRPLKRLQAKRPWTVGRKMPREQPPPRQRRGV